MILNVILILACLGILAYVSKKYVGSLDKVDDFEEDEVDIDLKYLIDEVSLFFSQALKKRYDDENLTREELTKKTKQTAALRAALTKARYGDRNSKRIIKNYIKDLLGQDKYGLANNIDIILPIYKPEKLNEVNDKFAILLYLYNRKFGRYGFSKLMEEFDLSAPYVDEKTKETRYVVTRDMISTIYQMVIIDKESENFEPEEIKFNFNDKLEILAQKIFEKQYGFGPVDLLYETNVDEIDAGVSGIPAGGFTKNNFGTSNVPYSFESIWIMWHGLNIHMECLSFETQEELIRVCDNIYKYDAPYVMSRTEGRVVSTMIDGSRIVVCRPPFAESYSFFLRKFDSAPGAHPADIIKEGNKVIPIVLMKWFIKGQRNIGITGSQGTGKTTMLSAMIRFIDSAFNLRIQELQFELNLRYAYPTRNIETFQETAAISAQEGLNLQKKTNGAVNIVGEVANAIQASHIIQTAMVASLFAMFTHHAKTAVDWVNAIADNLLQIGLYKDKKDAVRATAQVLNIDCHLANIRGHRYIERITEIVPGSDEPYPSKRNASEEELKNLEAKTKEYYERNALMDVAEYFERVTNPSLFTTNQIMHWVPDDETNSTGHFVFDNMPTDRMIEDMKTKFSIGEIKEFERDMEFIKKISNGEDFEGKEEWINSQLSA
jgi:pilus assembly protein CpaF